LTTEATNATTTPFTDGGPRQGASRAAVLKR
jgi:hypothetical protein